MQVPDQGRDSETVHSLCLAIGYPYPVLLGAPVSSGPKFQSLLREMLGDRVFAQQIIERLTPTSSKTLNQYMGLMSRTAELTGNQRQEFHDLMELNERENARSPAFTVEL